MNQQDKTFQHKIFHFHHERMPDILEILSKELQEKREAWIRVPSVSYHGQVLYTGECNDHGIYRPLHVWTDLADVLGVNIEITDHSSESTIFKLTMPAIIGNPDKQGYDPQGEWGRVYKIEDPFFCQSLNESLERVADIHSVPRILALGMNDGRELELIERRFTHCELLGIDREPAAIIRAAQRWKHQKQWHWKLGDINHLPQDIGQFDLIWCLSVLQNPSIRIDQWLAQIRKYHLHSQTAFILGFPNAKYRAGILSYGARMKNYARPDLSLITADLTDLRRRLQKIGYRVYITGKYELTLTAIPIK